MFEHAPTTVAKFGRAPSHFVIDAKELVLVRNRDVDCA
jgi:hypothetical protein